MELEPQEAKSHGDREWRVGEHGDKGGGSNAKYTHEGLHGIYKGRQRGERGTATFPKSTVLLSIFIAKAH